MADHGLAYWRRCAGAVLALTLSATGAAADEPAPAPRVLIATETSAFKDLFVTRLTSALRDDGDAVTVIALGELPQVPLQAYRAVVLVNTCRAWRPSSAVRRVLASAEPIDRRKLVVVTTANSGACNLGTPDVDAISAASQRPRADAVADQVRERVRAHVTGQ